jgi:uncharacterized cupin superfamily protein
MFEHVVTSTPDRVELHPATFPAEWILDGNPVSHIKEIARSRDGAMRVVVWECTKGRFEWQYGVNEMVHIISGEVLILDQSGDERRLGPGNTAFFPAGSRSTWRVTQDVRKLAVCHDPVPSLGRFAARVWKKIHTVTARLRANRSSGSVLADGGARSPF